MERGTFLASDLTWREGMAEWKPLDQVFGFAAAHSLSSPMSAFGAAAAAPPPMASSSHVGVGVMPTPGTAIASLVLGIVGFFSTFLCGIGGLLAIPGAICGHMALVKIRQSEGRLQGRGMAIAGLVTSYATIALGLLFIALAVLIMAVGASGVK